MRITWLFDWGEPYGTLILTLAVTAIEVISISTIMLHGENNPTLARDTVFAVVMIILNGMVGLSLLAGAGGIASNDTISRAPTRT
jgi:Ca2+/H+ antiporter